MRIGVDLDGVIYDLVNEVVDRWNFHYRTDFTEEDITDYEFYRCFNVSQFNFSMWWDNEVERNGLMRALLPYRGAFDFMQDLFYDDHELIIITKRDGVHNIVDTGYVLRRDLIPYHEVHFCDEKWRVDCDIYIDDNPSLIEPFAKAGKELVLVARPWTSRCRNTYAPYEELYERIEGGGK